MSRWTFSRREMVAVVYFDTELRRSERVALVGEANPDAAVNPRATVFFGNDESLLFEIGEASVSRHAAGNVAAVKRNATPVRGILRKLFEKFCRCGCKFDGHFVSPVYVSSFSTTEPGASPGW